MSYFERYSEISRERGRFRDTHGMEVLERAIEFDSGKVLGRFADLQRAPERPSGRLAGLREA